MRFQGCGIYKIENLVNAKKYIGQSINIPKRFQEHKSYAFNPNSDRYDKVLYKAMRKYGLENFSFEILEYCDCSKLDEREIYWIEYYDSYHNGYNLTLGGQGSKLYDYDYDYDYIVSLWKEGKSCQEIEKLLKVNDSIITTALRNAGISEEEVRKRSSGAKQYLAWDIGSNKPLKVFNGTEEIIKFFNLTKLKVNSFQRAAKNNWNCWGYKWSYYNQEKIPDLSDDNFLKYQQPHNGSTTYQGDRACCVQRRKVERPSRDELKKLIRNKPMTQIGKDYGVSDNAIRKWCDAYNLPRRVKDIKVYSDKEWELI